eukprot:Tbor_TRINITY_DN812_c0_g1::TRINITY_DN812_c0_g1_i1::g.26692::m.26692
MSSFAYLKANYSNSHVLSIYNSINDASMNRKAEHNAATRIQAFVRKITERRRYISIINAISVIHRTYRGYVVRKKTLIKRIAFEQSRRKQVYDYFATLIQSRFRGYWSRKTQYDFYSQKRYIAGIIKKSDEVRHDAEVALQKQQEDIRKSRHEAEVNEYESLLLKKHHLLSTATISGVYRPSLSVDGIRTKFGTNIEDDLRRVNKTFDSRSDSSRKFKPDLPTTTFHKETGPNIQPHTVSKVWTKGPLDRKPSLTLQASVQYDAVIETERYEASLNKAIMDKIHDKKQFIIKKPDSSKFITTVNCDTPYQEHVTLRTGGRK